jgi:hypothetical protein
VGIFDDEARKRANDQVEQVRVDAQREVDRSKIAHDVANDQIERARSDTHDEGERSNIVYDIAHDLQNDEASRPEKYGASFIIDLNTISITTPHRTLTIVCNSSDEFYLGEVFGFQTKARDIPRPEFSILEGERVNKSEMARRVLAWHALTELRKQPS